MVATPHDAATVVLMRAAVETAGKPEVLLLKRHARDAFAAGAHVFPGGMLEAADTIPAAQALSPAFPPAAAAMRLPDVASPAQALAFWIAAVRETFEEAGILLARHVDGRLWLPASADAIRLTAQRRSLHRGETTFVTMMHDLELYLATDLLVYFAHWITPESRPMRFSTRFFLAHVPAELTVLPAQVGVAEHVWLPPETALQRHASGTMEMLTVTTKILQTLSRFPSAAAAVEHLRDVPVDTVLPRAVVQADGSTRLLYPGDQGY
jgi:8-oxo-dGTP pyrophosphatase MutT (NUDIX family)